MCPSQQHGAAGVGFHINAGRSFGIRRGHNRRVSQPFLKGKAVEESESLKICANGAAKIRAVL